MVEELFGFGSTGFFLFVLMRDRIVGLYDVGPGCDYCQRIGVAVCVCRKLQLGIWHIGF